MEHDTSFPFERLKKAVGIATLAAMGSGMVLWELGTTVRSFANLHHIQGVQSALISLRGDVRAASAVSDPVQLQTDVAHIIDDDRRLRVMVSPLYNHKPNSHSSRKKPEAPDHPPSRRDLEALEKGREALQEFATSHRLKPDQGGRVELEINRNNSQRNWMIGYRR